ncbi:MAG TPA: SDR family oxidoreductase [Candidatus Acidoferrales bacterium]|nr:SDR family oxidoreductase [Candidatus Acidoferrales bacterium]
MRANGRPSFSLSTKLLLAGAAAAGIAYAVRERRRMDFQGKTVVISGGSRGLGLELARAFVREGANVVLLARNQDQLAGAAREFERTRARVSALACDVCKEDEVRSSVASIIGEFGAIDVLINNAGMIQVGPAEHMNAEDFAAAMDVHFWGPLYLMRAVIPHMKRRGHGRIVNVASIGGKVAVPHLLPYVASKFALVGLSEGMRTELAKDGIYVTTVCPGLMRTGSHVNAFFKGQHEKEFALFSLIAASPLFSTDSASAARRIVDACRYGASEIVITPQARLLRLVAGLFPNLVAEAMSVLGRALPGPADGAGDRLKRGWQSYSKVAPSFLTRPADRASGRNREARQPASAP